MADQVNIKHAFVSGKVDSDDTSIVSQSEWNAALLLSSGQDGQPILRDSSKPTGAKWGQGIFIRAATIPNYVGTTPTPVFGSVTVSVTDPAIVLLIPILGCTTVSGGAYTVRLRRNGAQIVTFVLSTDGTQHCLVFPDFGAVIGANTYDLIAESSGAVDFTAFTGSFTAVVLGSFS